MSSSDLQGLQNVLNNDPLQDTYNLYVMDSFGSGDLARISKGLKTNTVLKNLDLAIYFETDLTVMADALTINRSITHLRIATYGKCKEVLKTLVPALKVNPALTELELNGSDPNGLIALAGVLKGKCFLKILKLSSFTLSQAGGMALATALAVNQSLTTLIMNIRVEKEGKEEFDLKGLTALADALKTNKFLTTLGLYGIKICSVGGKALAAAVRTNTTLTVLELRSLEDVTELAASLCDNRTLTVLGLNLNKLGKKGADALGSALKVNTALKELHLDNCGIQDPKGLAKGLKSNRTLKTLVLSRNKFGVAGSNALASALKGNPSLTKLNLCDCDLKDMKELSNALLANRSLQALDISDNKLGDAVFKPVAVALRVNSTLTVLSLNSCDLADSTELSEMLKQNRTLEVLDLSGNPFEGPLGKAMAAVLKANSSLTELRLAYCGLEDMKELAESLTTNRKLRKLDLSHNGTIDNAGSDLLAAALKNNTTLTVLKLWCCSIDNITEMTKMLNHNHSLLELGLPNSSENPNKAFSDNLTIIERKITANIALAAQNKQEGEKKTKHSEETQKTFPSANGSAGANKQTALVGASLDQGTIVRLMELPEKHEALALRVRNLAVIDAAAMQALLKQAIQFQSLLEENAKLVQKNMEKDQIKSNPHLQVYYQFFARLLNGTWMACHTINSGMIDNGEMYKSDYVGQGLDQIGQRFPGISMVTGFLSGSIVGWNYREKRQAVQRMAMFFDDLETAFSALSEIARQVTIIQEKEICSMPTPQGTVAKMKEGIKDLAAFLLGADANTPLKRKAEDDCKKLLIAIKEGKLSQNATLADFLTIIMGAGFTYQSPVSATTSQPRPTAILDSSTPTTPATPQAQSTDVNLLEELNKLKEKDREREAEMKKMQEKVTKLEAQLPSDEFVESADGKALVQISQSKQAAQGATASSAYGAYTAAEFLERANRQEADIEALKARQREHGDDIDSNTAGIKALKKKRDKPVCIIS